MSYVKIEGEVWCAELSTPCVMPATECRCKPQIPVYRKVSEDRGARESWLTPYLAIIQAQYGCDGYDKRTVTGMLAQALRVLEAQTSQARVAEQLRAYVAGTPIQYFSMAKFGLGFGAWGKGKDETAAEARRAQRERVGKGL